VQPTPGVHVLVEVKSGGQSLHSQPFAVQLHTSVPSPVLTA
jgi:hypothetical protein